MGCGVYMLCACVDREHVGCVCVYVVCGVGVGAPQPQS